MKTTYSTLFPKNKKRAKQFRNASQGRTYESKSITPDQAVEINNACHEAVRKLKKLEERLTFNPLKTGENSEQVFGTYQFKEHGF